VGSEGSAGTAMLGLPGFVLLAVSQVAGELEQAVESTACEVFCPACGVLAKPHARRPTRVRDLPSGGRPVTLIWVKRVWRCHEVLCEKKTWSETAAAIRARAVLTERARAEACRRVGEDGVSVAAVARDLGVGWDTVMNAVRDYGKPLVEDPARSRGVERLGVDETAFLAATATRATKLVTGMVDLTHGRLLDVVDERSGKALQSWLSGRGTAWQAQIKVAVLDPYRGYAAPLRTLPNATVVVDAFHVVRLGFNAVDDVRRRVQQETTGHRGRNNDPLYRIRRVLRRSADTLTAKAWDKLLSALEAGDLDGQIARTWVAAQELRLVYKAADATAAAARLDALLETVKAADVPELRRLGKTLTAWRTEILAYHPTAGASNGPTEAINLLVKKIKRVGHGFRNFDNYRLRLLLHCGVQWNTPLTTPIRGRSPRLAG
jgi:transposase